MAHSSGTIMLRIQGREGMKRLTLAPSTTSKKLYESVGTTFGHSPSDFQLHLDKSKSKAIIASNATNLRSIGLNHGDLIYLSTAAPAAGSSDAMEVEQSSSSGPSRSSSSASIHRTASTLKAVTMPPEDQVDVYLKKFDGLIKRARDPKMCRHAANGQCIFCAPLEPYDDSYLRAQGIKHLSFHSYLRKLTGGIDKGKFVALEDLNVTIKEGCTEHPPWPRGICSKCQPSAVTLNRQTYRHVDNVMFENPQIVERFLSYWRTSGHQRIGLLYGKYEEHTDVPLGIRARVVCIYEPPQESTRDKVKFLPDERGPIIDELAAALGIQCVGWIFTDLLPEDTSKGTVKHLRGIHSYFLTAQECITAAYLQNKYPNPCQAAQSGYFGSKFATVLVTGDDKNQVHMVSYQVSNQCMALVRGNCLVPTRDAPEFGYIIESSEKKYVPDVFFKEKDEYGNEVTRLGRPLPVEYLLVDLTVSSPKEPVSMFTLKENVEPFPIENRYLPGQTQDFSSIAVYLSQFTPSDPFLRVVSDFHFLVYLATSEVFPMRESMGPLLEAVRDRNADSADSWSKSESWATLEQLIDASTFTPATPQASSSTGGARPRPQISPQSTWVCAHCTYINGGTNPNCEVCNLPNGR